MSNIALQIEQNAAGSVATLENVIFDTMVYSSGSIVYNSATGVITFNETGRYVINWWVATQSSSSLNGTVFALSSSQGDFMEGNSPIKMDEVVGMGIIDVVSAPVTMSLVNASTSTVYYSSIVPLKASLIVIEDDISEAVPDPFNVYVLANAAGGNGSQASPFGTIQEGVAAVLPTGTVHILGGTYPITAQIIVNKTGVTLQGYQGSTVLLQAPVIPFMIVGSNITIDGLTITSDNPYPVEFIQIGGSNHKISNNRIFGPPQAGPSTGWVVNRGFVPQIGNMTNLIVKGNIFYSMRQPAYLNPNTTGYIIDNVVYNTRGFVVDQGLYVFSGNSWATPLNATDIALLVGTTTGVPYDDLVELSNSNSVASIDDQR